MPPAFLTARWESLVFLNYLCPPDLLEPLVPRGTVLDACSDLVFVSVVGFHFAGTRVRGWSMPGHRTFQEVNLRFYVRRMTEGADARRGVVFIRELVPRAVVAAVARLVYNEPYLSVPMTHDIALTSDRGGAVTYGWRLAGARFALHAEAAGPAALVDPASEAAFITEHYWGYTRQRDGGTLEYRVEHPAWPVWHTRTATLSGPVRALYGDAFGSILSGPMHSAFIATGSAVVVHTGTRLDES